MMGVAVILVLGGAYRYRHHLPFQAFAERRQTLTRDNVAQVISDSATFYRFPSELDLPSEITNLISLTGDQRPAGEKIHAVVQYAFDSKLQSDMEDLLRSYGPDYGAFVAIDASTGRILSMISYSRDKAQQQQNLALRSSFPSASVFKVVTAAAAIEGEKLSPESIVPFDGRNHTLYRSNIMKTNVTRWTRYVTMKEAFAKSINTVFGKMGAYTVGAAKLRDYAQRFGFNRKISSDMPVQEGHAPITDDPWELAETASGYTRDNTMSPLQGALIAAAIANNGVMMEPYVVDSIFTSNGVQVYAAERRVASLTVDAGTAEEIRQLMRETVAHGTSRKAFHGFFKKDLAGLDVGGKTGSLTGMDPPGKYDWFVGYGSDGQRKIAMAALTIHQKLWRVKSSYLARRAMETYFHEHPQEHPQEHPKTKEVAKN